MPTHPKTGGSSDVARLHVRLGADQKALIERAASYAGETLTAFTVSTLIERARRIVAERDVAGLTDRDRDRFLVLLEAPPAPTPALRRAVVRHAHLIGRAGVPTPRL
jgi:uncharacterized protein (DUF1778 family)